MQNDTCYILALIKRDDGERLLLGSGFYEFTKEQKHFNPNLFANDVVELQGADGQLLAGQVRRSTAQSFDGYIGDGTTSKQIVEQKRREFFLFFRKQHHYTVVYIMPDGTAIKRDRGYIVDAPAVQELYQVQPKWHVSLAFEDVNYYSYAEDSQGHEIYAFSADLNLASVLGGGLKWDANGAISSPTGLGNIRINGDTFQQSYEGKNLFDIDQYINAILRAQGDAVSLTKIDDTTLRATNKIKQSYIFCGIPVPNYTALLGQTVTVSGKVALSGVNSTRIAFAWNRSGVSTFGIPLEISQNGDFSYAGTIPSTAPSDATGFMLVIYANGANGTGDVGSYVDWSELQLEVGSTVTSYEPYVGGTPSPNPDFPQPIQTVTGEQTITIGGTNYTVDLGATELCKLGDYQDYIWKDGEDWKLHKATASYTFDGSEDEGWIRYTGQTTYWGFYIPMPEVLSASPSFANMGQNAPDANPWTGGKNTYRITPTNNLAFALVERNGDLMTLDEWQSLLAEENMLVKLVLTTPTDTTITDATLIAQLNAIEAAMGADGQPTAIVPTGQNLAAIITGEPNGTGGYEWEASEGGGPSFITVEGVDDALPVWHVVGPATNPTLTNSSNGLSITWNGTVPAGQELIVDMGAQTATMEGANVFQYISGSWLTLSPGTNRIAYTAANTTAGSKIYWNEIVG